MNRVKSCLVTRIIRFLLSFSSFRQHPRLGGEVMIKWTSQRGPLPSIIFRERETLFSSHRWKFLNLSENVLERPLIPVIQLRFNLCWLFGLISIYSRSFLFFFFYNRGRNAMSRKFNKWDKRWEIENCYLQNFFFKRDFSARKRSERMTIVQRVNHTRPVYRITRGYTQAAEAF